MKTIPLYRCVVPRSWRHFLSTDIECEGQSNEGLLGNIRKNGGSGLVKLKRYFNPQTGAHVHVTSNDKIKIGEWVFEGTQGYVKAVNVESVVHTPDDGKRYFGFYAGAMDGVGDPNKNYIPELSEVSNIIFIKSPHFFEEKLQECLDRNLKAIITFDWVFLDENFRLKNTYAEEFINDIEPILKKYRSTIVAFYGQDEPYYNGLQKNITAAEVYYAQETMGKFLKSRFPFIPIASILRTNELKSKRNYPLFPSFDWFGFDCYNRNNKCRGKSVQWFYEHLKKKLKSLSLKDGKARYLISVPQAGHPAKESKDKGLNSIRNQVPYNRARVRENPNVKMVMPFIWQTFDDGKNHWIGAREIPESKELYKKFYKDFINRAL